MACWQDAKLTPPQEYITLQLHNKETLTEIHVGKSRTAVLQ